MNASKKIKLINNKTLSGPTDSDRSIEKNNECKI